MASAQVRRFLIGQVVAKGTEKMASVQVKCPKMVLDRYLLMYFNHPEEFWAAETPEVPCKIGDIVKIQELPERITPFVTHQVCEHVFKVGETIDPVTGRQCRATKFIDETAREKMKLELEKQSGKWFK